jgi:hypothetical protein
MVADDGLTGRDVTPSPATPDDVTVTCPKCGSESIRIWQVAVGTGEAYFKRDADGELEINYIDDPEDPEWEIDDRRRQFACGVPECGWEGAMEQLVGFDAAPSPGEEKR